MLCPCDGDPYCRYCYDEEREPDDNYDEDREPDDNWDWEIWEINASVDK